MEVKHQFQLFYQARTLQQNCMLIKLSHISCTYQNILVPTISYNIAATIDLLDFIIIPVYGYDHRIKLRRTLIEEPQRVIIYVRHDRLDREVMCI